MRQLADARVVVTGDARFLGSHLYDALVGTGASVYRDGLERTISWFRTR